MLSQRELSLRRAPLLVSTLAVCAGLGIGAPAMAQQPPARDGQGAGLRYLSWSGRPAPTVTAQPQPQRSEARPQSGVSGRSDLRRPSPIIPHAGADAGTGSATRVAESPYRPVTSPAPRAGLTPAGAWMGGPRYSQPAVSDNRPAAIETPPPAPMPAPAPVSAPARQASAPAPAPSPAPRFTSAEVAVASRPAAQPPARTETTAPSVPDQPVDDPMAPRRDAPIFRIQRDAASPDTVAGNGSAPPAGSGAVVATSASPDAPRQGSRYYSVHRQAGRQPDQIAMPEQIYLDAVPIELGDAPATEDLAEPPAAPQMARNAQGRLVPVPATTDSDLP